MRAAGAAVLSLMLAAAPWPSHKPFLRRLNAVRPGMTPGEARAVMAGYPEGTGWPANPFAEGAGSGELRVQDALVFRPSAEPGDSNWGVVQLGADGRVVSVRFLPD